jgi:hypothetical protein
MRPCGVMRTQTELQENLLTKSIFSVLPALLLSVAVAAPSGALAGEKEAKTCLDSKIWNGYNEGWAVRTAVDGTLKKGEHRVYLVTLYAGNEYVIQACGDNNSGDLDLVLHDKDGKEVSRDQSDDREPKLTYKPTRTDTFYVALYAATLAGEASDAGVAMAVTYK